MPLIKVKVLFYTVCILLLGQPLRAMDNPVSYEDGINDCDVIKYNGEYYITGNWLGGDMFRSRNLTDWGQRKHVFSWDNSWHVQRNTNPDMDIHGTHIAYDNGLFHLYAHLDTPSGNLLGIVHAVSNNVLGPYTEPVDAPFDSSTIDVNTFKDLDGSLHYYSTRFGGVSGNHNDYRRMSDYNTLTSGPSTLIWPLYDWEKIDGTINEGPWVFRYRDRYYMLFAANHTRAREYVIGCVTAASPNGFSNAGKYSQPVLPVTTYTIGSTPYEIYTLGQPWMVEGLNGFERWIGYFAIDGYQTSEGRTQRIDRVHFFDRTLTVDGPTNRYTPGYHPGPAEPQLRSLFYQPDGPMPAADWTATSPNNNPGQWQVSGEQALQSSQTCFGFNLVNREPATHYLFEANVKMPDPRDSEDKAGVVAYYKNADNWIIVGVDRSLGYGADNWYCHVATDTFNGVVAAGGFGGTYDYSVYHKIRVERNGTVFRVWIDDVLPPGFAAIQTDITDPGVPGLYADHAAALYDGIIYTIGWDEYDDTITGWGEGANNAQSGAWTVSADGLTAAGSGQVFKGDLMGTYEFSAQLYLAGTTEGKIGMIPVAVDQDNFLKASFNLSNQTFRVDGRKDGQLINSGLFGIPDKADFNLRAVKLNDRVIFFIDGYEIVTIPVSFPPSQVGLFSENMDARFNGILVYQTKTGGLPGEWKQADVGTVGFAGSATFNEGTFTVNGSGSDIWLSADGFHFVYQDLVGDGQIVARVVSNDTTHTWNKAAVMIRDGLGSGAPMAVVPLCGGGALQFLWRTSPGNAAQGFSAPNPPYAQEVWLKLEKTESTFKGSFSYDGLNWTQIASRSISFSSNTVQIGLAVTSHDNTRINGAVFDNVAVSGCTPGDYAADLTRDCRVDIEDLKILAEQWLHIGSTVTPADFDGNQKIDLLDYQRLAEDWLITYDHE